MRRCLFRCIAHTQFHSVHNAHAHSVQVALRMTYFTQPTTADRRCRCRARRSTLRLDRRNPGHRCTTQNWRMSVIRHRCTTTQQALRQQRKQSRTAHVQAHVPPPETKTTHEAALQPTSTTATHQFVRAGAGGATTPFRTSPTCAPDVSLSAHSVYKAEQKCTTSAYMQHTYTPLYSGDADASFLLVRVKRPARSRRGRARVSDSRNHWPRQRKESRMRRPSARNGQERGAMSSGGGIPVRLLILRRARAPSTCSCPFTGAR